MYSLIFCFDAQVNFKLICVPSQNYGTSWLARQFPDDFYATISAPADHLGCGLDDLRWSAESECGNKQ